MAYADPQSVTINAVANALPRVGSAAPQRKGVFSSADGNIVLTVTQDQSANRFRREARLTQRKIAADPISSDNKEVSTSVLIVVDEPKFGFDDVEIGHLTSALTAWFAASSNTARDKLLGGEL